MYPGAKSGGSEGIGSMCLKPAELSVVHHLSEGIQPSIRKDKQAGWWWGGGGRGHYTPFVIKSLRAGLPY